MMFCNFCGKDQPKVKKLIAGPNVYICNECVDLCHTILVEEGVETNKPMNAREVRIALKAAKKVYLFLGTGVSQQRFRVSKADTRRALRGVAGDDETTVEWSDKEEKTLYIYTFT